MKILLTSLFLIFIFHSTAQWSNTNNQFYDSLHMPVCTNVSAQQNSIVINSYPDSGYFVIWEDERNNATTKKDIYAQKYDKNGVQLWAANGMPVVNGPNEQHYSILGPGNLDYRGRPVAATDSANGFYITYIDDSTGASISNRICVQHVTSNGSQVFSGAGYIVAQTPPGQSYGYYYLPQLIADDNHGFYVAYIKDDGPQFIYIYCYKDNGGVMESIGGGLVNRNALQVRQPHPLCNYEILSVVYPGPTVIDYNIWPDLQGNCSIVMSMTGNASQGNMLGYNKVWKVKQNSQIFFYRFGDNYRIDTARGNDYTIGEIAILYEVAITGVSNIGKCGVSVWNDYVLGSNGFFLLSDNGYSYNYLKGITVSTTGNINAQLTASTKRTISGGIPSDYFVEAIGKGDEKYDSIPYQRASWYGPSTAYNFLPPPGLASLSSYDTIIAPSAYGYNFSLAGGGNQAFAAALVQVPGIAANERNVHLQHLSAEDDGGNIFSFHYKTNNKKGVIIGREANTGNGATSITYDYPLIEVNKTGNALFYINEYARSARVSPIINGAELAWGAMGKPIGSGSVNNSFYYPERPFVALDPLNGTGVITWHDSRTVPANTGSNIFMRRLDNMNVVNYSPPNKPVKLLAGGSTVSNPAVLTGSSKKYSLIEAYNSTNNTLSPVVEILDDYNLGAVPVTVYQHVGAVRTYNGKPYLNRNYNIKPENNPNGAATINLRLFFTTAEFDALKLADPTIINPGLLSIIKQPNATNTAPAAYTPVAGETELPLTSWQAVDGGYYAAISVTGFSNFFIQKISSALPVKWLGVQAQWQNNIQAKVSWQVAEQQNVKDYTVQYSEDGITYTNVCIVPAAAITSYNCIVTANSAVKNYYRVVEQDADGKKSFSKVVVIQSGTKPLLVIYPNPVKDKLYIDGLANYNALKITDAAGRIMLQQNISPGLKQVDTRLLNAGVYLITVSGDKETQTVKFIKQ
jgi:Secretion system C-terminal sorting domain